MKWFLSKKELKSLGNFEEWMQVIVETLTFVVIMAFAFFASAIALSAFTSV